VPKVVNQAFLSGMRTGRVFDMESVINETLVRDVFHPDLPPAVAVSRVKMKYLEETGSDFLPLVYHCPVSIAIAKFSVEPDNTLTLTSPPTNILPNPVDSISPGRDTMYWTDYLVKTFWSCAEQWDGVLISFNGRGYDLPVLEMHAMRLGLACPKYFKDSKTSFRHRYGRHIDLMDLMSNYGAARRLGGLDAFLKFLGLPGKSGIAGKDVDGLWAAGKYDEIDQYCREDVQGTFEALQRVELTRGDSGITGTKSGYW
jgi:3'-5' exonuclease